MISRKTAIALGDVYEGRFTYTQYVYRGGSKSVKAYTVYHDALYDFLYDTWSRISTAPPASFTGCAKALIQDVTSTELWVCPVSTDCLPLSHGTSSQANLLVLSGAHVAQC